MAEDQAEDCIPQMVCGRNLTGDPTYRKSAQYQGQLIYFCTHYCLEAFLADPDRFYQAHSRNRKKQDGD